MAKAKTAEEFDRRFDQGEDIFDLADIKPEDIKRPGLAYQRINIDVPAPMLERLDSQAAIRGITRQSLIKTWLYERLTSELATDRSSALYNEIRTAWTNALRNQGDIARKKDLARAVHTWEKVGSEEIFRLVLQRFFLEMLEQDATSQQAVLKKKEEVLAHKRAKERGSRLKGLLPN
jgi:predicted DNA binding CopG/RHH family protein